MSAEKFLIKLFEKFTEDDFQNDKFLIAFYKFYKKEANDDLFHCYIEYLIRNKTFNDLNHRATELKNLYKNIVNDILYGDEDASTDVGFIADSERKETASRQKVIHETATKTKTQVSHKKDKHPLVLNKERSLNVLSTYIKESFIITYDEPEDDLTKEDQEFREFGTDTILDEIKNMDGRVLPSAKKDLDFGKRVDMMNIWRDTENKCKELSKDENCLHIISKVYFIDSFELLVSKPQIKTVLYEPTADILPPELFAACYSKNTYATVIRLANSHPVDEIVNLSRQKIKSIYICSGSRLVSGGNADQGIETTESMPYLTSTYSIGLEKALHAYPLMPGQILLCPNILVFKDINYNMLPVQKWQKIAIMNAPSKWRPKVKDNNGVIDSEINPFDPYLTFANKDDITVMKNIITGMLETALFFGYDTVVLDDRGMADNLLPAYVVAKIMKEEISKFASRFKEIVICSSKAKSFDVLKMFFATR